MWIKEAGGAILPPAQQLLHLPNAFVATHSSEPRRSLPLLKWAGSPDSSPRQIALKQPLTLEVTSSMASAVHVEAWSAGRGSGVAAGAGAGAGAVVWAAASAAANRAVNSLRRMCSASCGGNTENGNGSVWVRRTAQGSASGVRDAPAPDQPPLASRILTRWSTN